MEDHVKSVTERQPASCARSADTLNADNAPVPGRRQIFALLGGAAIAWAPVMRIALAQQRAMPVIGFLNIASPDTWENYLAGFKQGLAQTGYFEGVNVAMEYRWARGQYDRLSAFATELADGKVTVIAANGGSSSALAAKAATTTIPNCFHFRRRRSGEAWPG